MAKRLCAIAIAAGLAVVASVPAIAQKLIGDRGASCTTIPAAGGSHVINVTGAIPIGSTVLIAAGTTGNAVYAGTSGGLGNTWTPTNSFAPSFRSFTILGRIDTAIGAGQTVTITYSSAPPAGQTSCASIAAFSGVARIPNPPVDATGANGATSSAPTATLGAATTQPRELLHFTFVLGGASGGITIPPPHNPLQLVCNGGNTFCVIHGYRVVQATTAYSGSATLGASVPWAGVITSYFSDIIFEDDFQ